MKKYFFSLSLIIYSFLWLHLSGCVQNNQSPSGASNTSDTLKINFDVQLANELGADDYGMRQYVMAFLKAGPNPSADSTEAMELQRAHLANIRRMAEDGDLVLAGPFMDSGDVRGIYIFDVRTVEEARELTETDPAIQSGALEMELRPWYGSAALMQVSDVHSQIAKENP